MDEEIAELGDGSVILCTDDHTIYDDIDEYEGIGAHLAITRDDGYVIGGAHVDSCENRHSFVRQWLAKFRGVSKHYLQGFLDFLGHMQNEPTDWFDAILYRSLEPSIILTEDEWLSLLKPSICDRFQRAG